MKYPNFLPAIALFTLIVGVLAGQRSEAAGTYSISCTNTTYGMQLSLESSTGGNGPNIYLDAYNKGVGAAQRPGAYVGNDCIYAGAGKTNGTAVVAADVTRAAVNAIVGSITNRIDQAFAQSTDGSGANMSFTNHGDGVGMAANRIFGGLSIWADYASTDFDNTQSFTNVRIDSNNYGADADTYSIGLDKTIGENLLVGLVASNFDTSVTTTFNDGTYKSDGWTYGLYAAFDPGMVTLDASYGTGDYDITTTRRDLGSDKEISGSTTADVTYYHVRASANIKRGRIGMTPRLTYRKMEQEIDGFTETVPSSSVTGGGSTDGIFNDGSYVDNDAADVAVTGRTVSSSTTEAGMRFTANVGKLVPYLDFAYLSESITAPAYESELGADGNNEQAASSDDSSWLIGAGINVGLGSRGSLGIRATTSMSKDDYDETMIGGSLRISF